jgi:uncharacterized protein (TIGR02452 family)
MERDDRIRVFKETVEAVRNGSYTNGKGESVEIPRVNDGLSIDSVTFYDKDIKKKINFDKLPRYQTEIKVINQDCLYAAKELVDDGFAPAVVNFASFAVPGGGVRKGSRAQEENICRRTNLFESIFRFIDTLAKEYGRIPQKLVCCGFYINLHKVTTNLLISCKIFPIFALEQNNVCLI